MDSTILLKVASVNKLEETIVKNLASEDMDCPIFTAPKLVDFIVPIQITKGSRKTHPIFR